MSDAVKPIYVIKDVKLLGIEGALQIQGVKVYKDENDKIFEKINHRITVSLENISDKDAEKKIKDLIGEICLAQAKEIGELNERINAMSKECAYKVSVAQKESSEKMILQTELLNAKDALIAHEENFKIAKSINDEIYAENQKLKADKEKLLAEIVKLDENIVSLNAQIVTLKKGK